MNQSDMELLSQYIDGELCAEQAQVLRRRLLADPALRACYDKLRDQNEQLRNAFNTPEAEMVPERVSALLQPSKDRRRAAWGFAIAASLLATTGLLLNPDWQQAGQGDLLLSEALESTPSDAESWTSLEDGRQLRPVLSFAHTDGRWCREFLLSDQGATYRGVACRGEEQWLTSILDDQPLPGAMSEYRPAGAGDSDVIAAFIAEQANGIALSRVEEAELISRNWK